MKGRVRRNQWIDDVIYNGPNLLLIEKNKLEKPVHGTTVFICDGYHLKVGEISDSGYVLRCVLGHDPLMQWHEYSQYFALSMVRVITCYLKPGESSLESASEELVRYITNQHINGQILLIGHSKGGLMMYMAGSMIPLEDREVSVITVSAPFAGTVMATKEAFSKCEKNRFPKLLTWFHSRICSEHLSDVEIAPNSEYLGKIKALPESVKHIAFISSVYGFEKPCSNLRDYLLKKLDGWCEIDGDGIVPFESQEMFPIVGKRRRMPDMCLIISATHNNSLIRVLEEFGKYAVGGCFFSSLEEFRDSKEIQRLVGYY